jgi:sterol desaturase/sphingolipid hydroxylase (fatty acid hydroxylase superfamily)
MDRISEIFAWLQLNLFEQLLQPLMFTLGWGHLLEDGYAATGWLLVGLLQLLVMLVCIRPLERWRPVEPPGLHPGDARAVRTDVLYTLIHRLGLFRVVFFFTLTPLLDQALGVLHLHGWRPFQLDDIWPGVTDRPWFSWILYLLVFDLAEYGVHRAQHHFDAWWALHALHHSQRQLTLWSDNRNHFLDDVVRDVLMVLLGQCIGIAPGQFVALVAVTQLSQSLQHANVRLDFGTWGERLWISPRFHRIHHSLGIGHERPGLPGRAPALGGCNFGVLLPWWDMVFGTADWGHRYDPTGVRDQVEQGRDYGHGLWSQQWRGLMRLLHRPGY